MKIKEGTILEINHIRKGKFFAMAMRDFDTTKEEFYPIKVAQLKPIRGMANDWEAGEEIPCRNNLCSIKIVALDKK